MDLAYRELLQSTIVKVQHGELKLGTNVLQKLMPIFSQLLFPNEVFDLQNKKSFGGMISFQNNIRLFRHMTSSACHQENLNFNTTPKGA